MKEEEGRGDKGRGWIRKTEVKGKRKEKEGRGRTKECVIGRKDREQEK